MIGTIGLLASAASMVVAIDPGHGYDTNSGALTVRCESEAAVNLRLAEALARDLRRHGFEVHLLRRSNDGPSYARRIRAAKRRDADVLLSLHGDARGLARDWRAATGKTCPRNDDEPGFAILYSEDGASAAVAARRRLARAIATTMVGGGFEAYSGVDYGAQYRADTTPGVFRDRRGLFMLRRPAMPSVIIETHHLWHRAEHERWSKPATMKRFSSSIVRALKTFGRSNPGARNTR